MEAEFVLTPEEQDEAVYDYVQRTYNVRVQSFVAYGVRKIDNNLSVWFTNDAEKAGEAKCS